MGNNSKGEMETRGKGLYTQKFKHLINLFINPFIFLILIS